MNTGIISEWIKTIGQDSLSMNDYRKRSQEFSYFYNWIFNAFDAEAVTYEGGDEVCRDIIRDRAKLYAKYWMKSMPENGQ
ncbi:MAG: hypothetical protein AAGA02_06635 [Bacteroidota bacterium]